MLTDPNKFLVGFTATPQRGDDYVEKNSGAVPLLLRAARWRSDPPSAKQIETLQKLGIPFDRATLTKGEAALWISNFFAHKKLGSH